MNRKITITMDIEIAETLHGLLDGCLGTSEDQGFNEQIQPLRNSLEKKINRRRNLFKISNRGGNLSPHHVSFK